MKNITKEKKLLLYIFANIILVAMMVLHTFYFITALRKNSLEDEKQKFEQSVNVIGHQVTFYMDNSKRIVRDWVHLLERRDWTYEEIAEKLGDMNSDDRIMIMVLSADEMSGFSALSGSSDIEETDYSGIYSLSRELAAFRESALPNDVYITSTFTNAISGEQCIAFVSLINTKSSDGEDMDAFLLRVEPLEVMKENWFFSSTYSSAQISMINSFGDYIYRAPMLKNNNFYEFLMSYNDFTYPQIDELRNSINETEGTCNYIYKNSLGNDTLYAFSAKGYNDWIIVGSIELDYLGYSEVQWALLISPLITSACMIIISIIYFSSLNRQLRRSMKDLEKANAAKTLFLSSMSHDIRTPMNAIMGLTNIAQRNINDKERVENCLGKISLAGRHLLTLINDVLDISQVESGKFTLNPTTFSLASSAEDLVNIIYPQAADKKLHCSITLKNITEEHICADKLRLNQIWINILSNAVKYTHEGGRIDITIEEFFIPEDPSSIGLIFKTADTGEGMSPDFVKDIFGPFSREKDSRIDKIQGSGLGMAITKQIVDLLGGTIKVESEQGKGSTFTVTLILKRGRSTALGRPFSDKSILLVGGENVMRSTAAFIEELGGSSECADSAEEAVKLVDEKRSGGFEMIIIDRVMAETSCIDTARALHGRFGGDCPMMLISAFDCTDIEHDAAEAGVSGFIPRPIFKEGLLEKYNALTRDKEEHEENISTVVSDFNGARVLVAEDNDINWEIINDLLGMYGIVADRAENGSECIKMLEQAGQDYYDMIFMDIQMPVMNGYETTREIRRMDDEKKAKIPIVAMTANAFAEDVSSCIEAGMNGHIAKPVDLKILITGIKKYVRKKG